MITYNTDGMVVQQFPFPAPIMDYIFKNLQPQHLLKLYQCGKFFYAKYQRDIIQNLEIVDDDQAEMFTPAKTVICVSNPILKKLKDFWLTDSFAYHVLWNIDEVKMPSFTHCTVKKLEACDHLTWEDYKTLTKAETVQKLIIGVVRDGEVEVPLEKLIAQVPNATSIQMTECFLSPTTCVSLAAMDHKAKITNFVLENIRLSIDINLNMIFEFLKKHADMDCKVHFDFKTGEFMEEEHIEQLEQIGFEYTKLFTKQLKTRKEIALLESMLMP